jgi:hypothetical protein
MSDSFTIEYLHDITLHVSRSGTTSVEAFEFEEVTPEALTESVLEDMSIEFLDDE